MNKKQSSRGTMAILSTFLNLVEIMPSEDDSTSFWTRKIKRPIAATNDNEAANVAVTMVVTVDVVTVEIMRLPLLLIHSNYTSAQFDVQLLG
jgi:hypothetical protein